MKNVRMLHSWKEDIMQDGIQIDKYRQIEIQTNEYFKDARKCIEQVKLKNIYIY